MRCDVVRNDRFVDDERKGGVSCETETLVSEKKDAVCSGSSQLATSNK